MGSEVFWNSVQITADTHLYKLLCSLQYSLLEAGSSPDLQEIAGVVQKSVTERENNSLEV